MKNPVFLIGLTGGIASGKSTVAREFRRLGFEVFDADEAVHQLYAPGGAAVAPIVELVGDCLDANGGIDRKKLAMHLQENPQNLRALEAVVHPLVRDMEEEAGSLAKNQTPPLLIVDVPLLFETGRHKDCDAVITVYCAPETQRERALAREGMTPEKLDFILSRQWPTVKKLEASDYGVNSDQPLGKMLKDVAQLADTLKQRFGRKDAP